MALYLTWIRRQAYHPGDSVTPEFKMFRFNFREPIPLINTLIWRSFFLITMLCRCFYIPCSSTDYFLPHCAAQPPDAQH